MKYRQMIPVAGLVATIALAGYIVVRADGQSAAVRTGNFTNAATAEVRDLQGQVVLRGEFVAADEDDDDVERKAVLKATGVIANAKGEAEVEFAKDAPALQEVEFSVQNLAADTEFRFVIDGVEVATAKTDSRGQAEVELDVKIGTP